MINVASIRQTGIMPSNCKLIQTVHPLQVLECASVVSEAAGGKPVLKITGIFQKADEYNQNGRSYPYEILKEAVTGLQPDLSKRAIVGEFDHPCLISSDFRVLTVDGWKEFKDIKIGDYVWSRVNGKTVKSRVNEIINEPYNGSAFHIKNRFIDSTFTGGHRALLLDRSDRSDNQFYATFEDIFENRAKYDKNRIPKTAEWNGESPEFVVIPGISQSELNISINRFNEDITQDLAIDTKLFCQFLGIYLAEGHVTNKNYGIFISQKNDWGRKAIWDLLAGFPLEWHEEANGFYCSDARLHKYLSKLGDKYTKFIPSEVKGLASDYLMDLINWFCIGDGRIVIANPPEIEENWDYNADMGDYGVATMAKPYVRSEVFTVSQALIRDLHECLVRAGGCGKISVINNGDRMIGDRLIEAENSQPLYQLHISKLSTMTLDQRFTKIEKLHHDGNIYCLTVDAGNFYMEQNGHAFWTGNCDAKIHLDRLSHVITKVWMESKYVYGVAEVLEEMPCGKMLGALLRAKVQVGISSRGVGDLEVVNEGTESQHYKVCKGYQIVTWDVVGEPSVQEAVLSVMESRNRILTRSAMARLNPEKALDHAIKEWLRTL